jgi:proteasome lid subunit RPN8/RPN11
MLKLARDDYNALRHHGEETYPNECCGVLLGQVEDDGGRIVTSTARCGNTRTDSPQNRYRIDPKELIRIQREGRGRGEDIVGFYHSHPDHPAQWSSTDFAEAHWIGCSYVITAVEKGKATITNSFALVGSDEADKKLVDEKMEIVGSSAEAAIHRGLYQARRGEGRSIDEVFDDIEREL